jgi:hypothetical protein
VAYQRTDGYADREADGDFIYGTTYQLVFQNGVLTSANSYS